MNKFWVGFGIFIAFCLLYWYRLPQSLYINTDYGKDLFAIAKISRGHFSLLGPVLSAGFFAGPYYYYLMVPALLLSGFNPYALAATSVVLFSSSLAAAFYFFSRKFSLVSSVLAVLALGISPLFIMAAREPANGLTYLPLLLLFICLVYFQPRFSLWSVMALGLLAGVILNFDPVSVLALFPLTLYLIFKIGLKKAVIYGFFVLITYLPLMAFEVKNNFVISRGFFLYKNYRTFLNNNNVVGAVSGSKNLIENFSLISSRLFPLVGLTPLVWLLLVSVPLTIRRLRPGSFIISLISFVLTVVLVRFKLEIHYLFPVSLLLLFSLLYAVASLKKTVLLLVVVVLLVAGFPVSRYRPTTQTFSLFQNAVDFTLSHRLIDPQTPFNLIAITDPHDYVPIGNEYRFAYLKRGLAVNTEFQYPQSRVLLLFSQIGDFDISSLNNWEVDQFGRSYLKNYQEFHAGQVIIYRVEK